MSLHKAHEFIKRAVVDKELRKECYSYKSQEALAKAYDFSGAEFDDALNALLFKCKSYDQAEVLRQIQIWFSLFPKEEKETEAE